MYVYKIKRCIAPDRRSASDASGVLVASGVPPPPLVRHTVRARGKGGERERERGLCVVWVEG